MLHRATDSDCGKRYFRSAERLFRVNGGWFFASREGEQGPYQHEGEADLAMSRYVAGMQAIVQQRAVNAKLRDLPDVEVIELRDVGGERVLALELEDLR